MRTQLFAIVALGTAACAATDAAPDELADETGNEDAGKQDGEGAFTYWRVEKTATGFTASRPNRTATECGGGVHGASCEVASIDLSGTAMPDSVARGIADRLGSDPILLRGELADDYGPGLAAADLAPATPGVPSIHAGDENGPDCLYTRLFVQDVALTTAAFTTTPTGPSTFAFHARFGGVSIPSNTEFAVACVNGTSTQTVKIATLTASGVMTVAADGTVALSSISSRLEGVTYDSPKLPPDAIMSMTFDNEAAVANIVLASAANALQPLVAGTQHARALAATEVWMPGSDSTDLSGVFVLALGAQDGVFEQKLNSTRSAHIDEIDFTASGATDEQARIAGLQLLGEDGVLVVGYRYIEGGKHGRAANQFWTRAPVPLH